MRIQTEYMTVIRGAPRHVISAPRLVAGAPSYSEGQQECPDTLQKLTHLSIHSPSSQTLLEASSD